MATEAPTVANGGIADGGKTSTFELLSHGLPRLM